MNKTEYKIVCEAFVFCFQQVEKKHIPQLCTEEVILQLKLVTLNEILSKFSPSSSELINETLLDLIKTENLEIIRNYKQEFLSSWDPKFFEEALVKGRLEVAKWLWSLKQDFQVDIDPARDDNCLFIMAAGKGYLDVLKWLWSLKQDFQVDIDPTSGGDNHAFIWAAATGHLKVLKWLWSLKQDFQVDIDPTADDNRAFRWAAKNGRGKVLNWLLSLKRDFQVDIHF